MEDIFERYYKYIIITADHPIWPFGPGGPDPVKPPKPVEPLGPKPSPGIKWF